MATKPFLSQIAVPVGTTTGDVYYPQTSLLMHFNGTNGSTTMTDNSKNNLTVTSVNGAFISTAQSKFGGASCFFDGTNDYLTTNSNVNLALESANFTIEGWFYFIDGVANLLRPVLGNYSVFSSNSIYFGKHTTIGGKMSFWIANYSSGAPLLADPSVLTNNQWIHFAIVRNGSNWTMYRDGISVATATYSGITSTTNFFYIGTSGDGYYFQGYIDELRITNGYARYTSNFTPSTTQFLDSAGDANSNVVVNSTATGFAIGTGGINGAQLAKAWVNFNGTGTVAIRDSYNVSSITDLDTGNYRVNFSSTFSTIPTVVASTSNEAANSNFGVNVNSHTTSTVQIYCVENGIPTDKSVVSVIVFRN